MKWKNLAPKCWWKPSLTSRNFKLFLSFDFPTHWYDGKTTIVFWSWIIILKEVWPYFVVPGIFHLKTGSFWIPVSLWLCLGNGCIHFYVSMFLAAIPSAKLIGKDWTAVLGIWHRDTEKQRWTMELKRIGRHEIWKSWEWKPQVRRGIGPAQNRMKNSHRKSQRTMFQERRSLMTQLFIFFTPFFEVIYIFAVNIYLTWVC